MERELDLEEVNLYNESPMRAIDLYSGVGGWSLGLRMAGIKVVRSFEWWGEANATHNLNFGTHHRDTDIRRLRLRDLDDLGKIDLVVGSPPCTQFSFSNRGGSGDIEDGLVDIRKFLEVVDYVSPKYWAMENVPRVAKILEESLRPGGPLARFRKLVTTINVVDSADFGVPQNRRRMIAGDFPSELFLGYKERATRRTLGDVVRALAQNPSVDPVYGFRLAKGSLTDHQHEAPLSPEERRLNEESKRYHPVYNLMQFPDNLDRPSRTVTATCTRVSRESIVIKDSSTGSLRRLTVREKASVQSFPITFQFCGTSYPNRQKMVGNAVPPLLTYQIACSMRRVPVDRFGLPEKTAAAVHPLPSFIPPSVPVDVAGAHYPAARRFRSAVQGFRFGSGVRLELANMVNKEAVAWRIGFYFGSSKAVRSVPMDNKLEKRILTQLDDRLAVRAASILDKLDAIVWPTIENDLQSVWTRRKKGVGPFALIDQVAEIATSLRKTFQGAEQTYVRCLDAAIGDSYPVKLAKNADAIVAGLLVGARFNALLSSASESAASPAAVRVSAGAKRDLVTA